jgi:GrpB-like predicted nucleotidyltransferase (UPF0157 family)
VKTQKVVVVPYTPQWKSDFEAIKQELERALGDLAVSIEHVGSTAVEGLSAKPIIDIDVVIEDDSVFDRVKRKLEAIGYIHEGNLGIEGREAFRYEDKPHLQTHHLYVCPRNSKELMRHITFREFLRKDPEARKTYSEVKQKAAERFPDDIEQYMEYKSSVIEALYTRCGLK